MKNAQKVDIPVVNSAAPSSNNRDQRKKEKAEKKEKAFQLKYDRYVAKYEQAKAMREMKQRYRQEELVTQKQKWFHFFTKWFFLGLFLILFSVLTSLLWVPQTAFLRSLSMILSSLLSTVGAALLVGSIFDFSKNSEAFIQFVSKILSDIIISKTFLASLSDKDKEEALTLILKPSDKQIEHYSNINAFF